MIKRSECVCSCHTTGAIHMVACCEDDEPRFVCICPGNTVPFFCPVHARVENPNWPLLKKV